MPYNSRLRRNKRMARTSKAGRQQRGRLAGAYRKAGDADQCWCSACGKPGATDHSHHFSQGQHQQHATDQRNWVRLCRADHELFENKRAEFARRYPELWASILADMQQVDPDAYRQMVALHPEWIFPPLAEPLR